ncbi:gp53-like domain-containing protein [Enterobacter sichuanensis]
MTAINSPPLCRGGRIFTDFAMCNCFSKNLRLGEAAKRGVGTAANQLPDMASFTRTIIDSKTQIFTFPNGMMLQTGFYTAPEYTGTLTFPVPFPTRLLAIAGINFNSVLGTPSVVSSYAMFYSDSGNTKISISSNLPSKALSYIAIGV